MQPLIADDDAVAGVLGGLSPAHAVDEAVSNGGAGA